MASSPDPAAAASTGPSAAEGACGAGLPALAVPLRYLGACPVCGEDLDDHELRGGLCRTRGTPFLRRLVPGARDRFLRFLGRAVGAPPTALERWWAHRFFLGGDLLLDAPTGMGKTSFALALAAHLVRERKARVLVVAPTGLLLEQMRERLAAMGAPEPVLPAAHSPRRRAEAEAAVRTARPLLALVTNAWLARSFDGLAPEPFDLVVVDDVDALFRQSRNLERVLRAAGFSQREIETATPERRRRGRLVFASATARTGRGARLLRALTGLAPGGARTGVRRVRDVGLITPPEERLSRLVRLARALGPGVLVFARGEAEAHAAHEALEAAGVRAGLVHAGVRGRALREAAERFASGELAVLVGIATAYGPLVRGLDLPLSVRCALFLGVPLHVVDWAELRERPVRRLWSLLRMLRRHPEARAWLRRLDEEHREEIVAFLDRLFASGEVDRFLPLGALREGTRILLPRLDVYLQGSGRTSRLFSGGLTEGVSVVLDDPPALEALARRARVLEVELEIRDDLAPDELAELRTRLEESRRPKAARFDPPVELWLVESPTKARQIPGLFARPSGFVHAGVRFFETFTARGPMVTVASRGHVVDLAETLAFHGVEVNPQPPRYRPLYGFRRTCRPHGTQGVLWLSCLFREGEEHDIVESREVVRAVEALAPGVTRVVLATDPDTEGEKIGLDLGNFTAFAAPVERAEFHEITRGALERALSERRGVLRGWVEAQLFRRIEDRWVGFELSRILQHHFGDPNESAGRAQSVVLGWVVARGEEAKRIVRSLDLVWEGRAVRLLDEIARTDLPETFTTPARIERVEERVEPAPILPPFSTDSVLVEAERRLRLSAGETMRLLQELFESGLITYHRTDSVRVSERGLQVAREMLGEDFVPRSFASGGEGAHECIRPTRPLDRDGLADALAERLLRTPHAVTRRHLALYDLIVRRFLASQARPGEVVRGRWRVVLPELALEAEVEGPRAARGPSVTLYPEAVGRPPPLPERFEGEVEVRVRRRRAVPFLSEGEAVALMKRRGIGRPSTYATILRTLLRRGYVVSRRGFLIPTARGVRTHAFLVERFSRFVSEETTREMERTMDAIARGEADLVAALDALHAEIAPLRQLSGELRPGVAAHPEEGAAEPAGTA